MCERRICKPRPADIAVCDCYEYCPICGTGTLYYTPDLNLSTYESGEIHVLTQCPRCGYKSTQGPAEVTLV